MKNFINFYILSSAIVLQFLYSQPLFSSLLYFICTFTIIPFVMYNYSRTLVLLIFMNALMRTILAIQDNVVIFVFEHILFLFILLYSVYLTKFFECLNSLILLWLIILFNARMFITIPKFIYDICYAIIMVLLYSKVINLYKIESRNSIYNIILITTSIIYVVLYIYYTIIAFDISSSLSTRLEAFSWIDSKNISNSVYTYHMNIDETYEKARDEYLELIDDIYERGKNESISLKIQQFGNNYIDQVNNTKKICSYSDSLNISCIISAYTENYRDEEYNAFIDIIPYMKNKLLGLCIVVDYNNQSYVNKRIDTVIKTGGFVRLVKGGWYQSSTQYIAPYRWKRLSNEYINISKKLIDTDTRHLLASHDPYVRKYINGTRLSRWNIFSYTFPQYYNDNTIVSIFYGTSKSASGSIVNTFLRFLSLRTFGF